MATKVLDITKEQGYNVLSVEHVEGTTHKVTIKK